MEGYGDYPLPSRLQVTVGGPGAWLVARAYPAIEWDEDEGTKKINKVI